MHAARRSRLYKLNFDSKESNEFKIQDLIHIRTFGAMHDIELVDSHSVEVHAVSPILIRWVISTEAIPRP